MYTSERNDIKMGENEKKEEKVQNFKTVQNPNT